MNRDQIKALADRAAKRQNQAEVVETARERRVIPAGKSMARLVEYVELGKQPRTYKGEKKPAQMQAHIVFELLSKNNIYEVEVNGEKIKKADRIVPNGIYVSLGSKTNFRKLFEKLRAGREEIKHFGQMLGEAFVVEVVHNTKVEGDTKTTYANIQNAEREYLIYPPYIDDVETGERKYYKVPEALSPLKIFIFDEPTKESWDSLFIEGSYERTVNGEKVSVSLNKLQETIKKAENFKGSAVELMLQGAHELDELVDEDDEVPFDTDVEFDDSDTLEELAPETKKKPAKKETKKETKKEVEETDSEEDDESDIFDDLGF